MENARKKAKFIAVSLMVFSVITLAVIYANALFSGQVFKAHSQTFTVVIDAGHGGIDGGVLGVNSGVKESDINLDIAKKLKAEFENAGVKVVMTRSTYGGLYGTTAKGFKLRDMKKRVQIINSANANLMISVHQNFYSSASRRGATAFFGTEDGKRLAECVQIYLNALSGQPRPLSPLKGDYYLLNYSTCPAVICECGFLSNSQDEALLLTEEYRQEVAKSIFCGAITFLME